MSKKINLIGQKFGRLTVISEAPNIGSCVAWRCLCDCGNQKDIRALSLTKPNGTKSCGCLLSRENRRLRKITHGDKDTRLYRIWSNMKSRCNNKNRDHYADYGGRGIRVCDEWANYVDFKKWALANGYKDDLTLDRIDNDQNYSPTNCRWASLTEQNRNKRTNRKFKGKTVAEWAKETGVSECLIYARLDMGWDFEKAISEPPHKALSFNGKSIFAWSKETGIPYATIVNRLKKGWNPERAIFEPSCKV